jgi:hypothetical protein
MVPLGIPLKVAKIGFFGTDPSKLPLKENGTITAKDFKEAMAVFFDNDEDPEIDKTVHEPDDETQVLPFVTILEGDNKVTYRAPLIMSYFLLEVATGMIINNSRLRKNPNLENYVPFEIKFFNKPGKHDLRGRNLGALIEMCNDLGDDAISLTRN